MMRQKTEMKNKNEELVFIVQIMHNDKYVNQICAEYITL